MKPVYLIDYSNYAYRFSTAFSRYYVMQQNVKVSYGVLYGFVQSLRANVFKDIIICLDGDPTINLSYLPSYKGHRLKEPDDSHSVPRAEVIKFLTQIGEILGKNIYVVASPNQEADQVISSITHQIVGSVDPKIVSFQNMMRESISVDWRLACYTKDLHENYNLDLSNYDTVILGTTDSDMYQLVVNPNVHIDGSTCGKEIKFGMETPKEVHHLPPGSIPAYKAIVGDNSDNVPSLQVPNKLASLLEIVTEELNSVDKLHHFIRCCEKNTPELITEDRSKKLAKHIINTNQVDQLRINNRVTELVFWSTPIQLSYDYDIQSTIKRYGLRL